MVTLRASANRMRFSKDGVLFPVSKWDTAEGLRPVRCAKSDWLKAFASRAWRSRALNSFLPSVDMPMTNAYNY